MRLQSWLEKSGTGIIFLGGLPWTAFAGDVLSSSGFTNCLDNATITVQHANITFDRSTGTVVFDVTGTSAKEQKVKASLVVSAYGNQVFQKDFDPCNPVTKVVQLCPVPAGTFGAHGSQVIPANFISQIPSIAFSIPDLDGLATLELAGTGGPNDGKNLACVKSGVTNGKSLELPVVSYIAISIAGAALALTGLATVGGAGTVGGHAPSVTFSTTIGWFQSMALNGMMSVNYPPVYRSFAKNFAFSGGLIPWNSMQSTIDNFRNATGGNLTTDSVQYLQNSTLIFTDGSSNSSFVMRRNIDFVAEVSKLYERDITANINGTQSGSTSSDTTTNDMKLTKTVHGIQAYVENLTIPQANTFMTILLVFTIVIAAIAVGILLLKVILELWSLFGSFPKRLTGFRKRYWRLLANTVTNLILVLFGVWTLYCVFQFMHGDSWAAKVLAGVTLGIFTAILVIFTFRIFQLANKFKKAEGDASALFDNKETWIRYSLFYDCYKRDYWWLFVPVIIYMFAKGCVIAAFDGHGLTQSIGQLIVETLMFVFLLWNRPYTTAGGNWINIVIQFVRVLSVVCILVFVEQLGIAQTTKTVIGVALIAVQSILTGVLAILIAVNGIIVCCKENPHRKKRKEAENLRREFDNLTPLDARNSLLIDSRKDKDSTIGYQMGPYSRKSSYGPVSSYPVHWEVQSSSDSLVRSAASMGYSHERDSSRDRGSDSLNRQSALPDTGYDGGYGPRRVI